MSVTDCVPVMSSVEKSAAAPVPLAMAPPDQFAVLFHVPPDALVHVPFVCAGATVGSAMSAATNPSVATNPRSRGMRSGTESIQRVGDGPPKSTPKT